MKLIVLGLSLSSSWGNGHATTYRALLKAFARRGHDILFLERDVPWYREHRDVTEPDYRAYRTALCLADGARALLFGGSRSLSAPERAEELGSDLSRHLQRGPAGGAGKAAHRARAAGAAAQILRRGPAISTEHRLA